MQYEYHNAFLKDVKKLPENIRLEIAKVISAVASAEAITNIAQSKKLLGYKNVYRIRLKDYRIGCIIENDMLIFSRVLHRKEIYRYFPK